MQQSSLATFLISEHIRDIQREADAQRLARAAAPVDATERTRSAWRRQLGGGARRLSAALDELASELDPATCRPSYGRE
jgi:hypothetical protein